MFCPSFFIGHLRHSVLQKWVYLDLTHLEKKKSFSLPLLQLLVRDQRSLKAKELCSLFAFFQETVARLLKMFSKTTSMTPKVITNENHVRTRGILDKENFLRQHNNSKVVKKILKDFEDAKLMKLVSFDHGRLYKKEVTEFYINATITGDRSIKFKVNGVEVALIAEDIREEFNMEEASNLDVSSHAFDHKKFWGEIKQNAAAKIVKFSGKQKDMLKQEWNRPLISFTSSWRAKLLAWMT